MTERTEQLIERIVQEWNKNTPGSVEPIIIEEQTPDQLWRVYVVWRDWSEMEQVERSEIIMDAFERVYGQDEALHVTMALGLTPEEADRLGIQYR